MAALYPIASDLTAYLTEAGVTITSAPVQSAALLAGIQGFERDTGRHFLAGKTIANADVGAAGVETRYFDPPATQSEVLELGPFGDLASITSVAYAPASSSPTTLVAYTDYWPLPANGPAAGWPYTSLRIRSRWWSPLYYSYLRGIQVAGKWGFGLTIPDDAWLAMLQGGALWLEGQYRLGATGGRTGYTVGPVSEQFGVESYSKIVDGWRGLYGAAVKRYRRWEV